MSSKNIDDIYKEAKSKGTDYLGTLLFIFIIASVFGYLYTSAQNKILNLTWNEHKCNPRYLFFSGFLNPENKTPWTATEDNFNQCVGKSIYKHPQIYKDIKRNDRYIKLHDNQISENLTAGESAIDNIRNQWEEVIEKKDMATEMSKSEAGGVFEKQGDMHNVLGDKTTQMFDVLQSTIIYIKGVLLYRVSEHKKDMSIDKKHEYFMKKYADTYEKYKKAFKFLDERKWTSSMNTARDAIQEYEDLTKELSEFIDSHLYQITDITESCYHLKYNLEDNSCEEKIYPQITKEWIDFYPIIKSFFPK